MADNQVAHGCFCSTGGTFDAVFSISVATAAEGVEDSLGEAQKPFIFLYQCGLHHSGHACQQVH